MKKYLMCITAIFMLSSCSFHSLTEEQCLTGDWKAIGYNDGSLGYSKNRINAHQEACAETGVIPNFKLWEKGRQQGLEENYCTETNVYQLGISGRSFEPVCSIKQHKKLEPIYLKAHNKYIMKKEISDMKKIISKHKAELKKLRNGEMLDFKTEREARSYMLDLQKEINLLENQILRKRRRLLD